VAPNIFHYATKELSQDAFFCWLLAWADASNAGTDEALHGAGLAFLNALMGLHGEPPERGARVEIRQQLEGADIVAEVGERLLLLIEDKVHAGLHGDQLERYRKAMNRRYPGRTIVPVFLKTGDQSGYGDVTKAGYRLFLRDQLLCLLRPWRDRVSNAIFTDFIDDLERRHAEVEAYATTPVASWVEKGYPWVGLYKRLQCELSHLGWAYVSNASGGFVGAWWHFRDCAALNAEASCKVYLQIEQGPLCFKIAVTDGDENRAQTRTLYRARLEAAAREAVMPVMRPSRMGSGSTMTIGRIERAGWLAESPDGMLDLDQTLANLRAAASILDRVASAGHAAG
jgi:hypothetical protein